MEKIRRATLKGWCYALDNSDEMIDLILEKYNVQGSNRAHLAYEAKETAKLIISDLIEIGSYNQERYQEIAKTYVRAGFLEEIKQHPGFFYQVASFPQQIQKIDLTMEERAWIDTHPVIRLSVDNNFPPHNFTDKEGMLKGMTIDYVRLIEKKLGLKIDLVGSDWPTALDSALKHEVDGILNADVVEERKRYLNFTEVYKYSPQTLVAREDESFIDSLEALCGRKVAAIHNTSTLNYLRTHYPCIELLETRTNDESLLALVIGEVDAVFDRFEVLNMKMKEMALVGFKSVYFEYIPPVGFSRIGVRKDQPLLVSMLNKAIASITYDERDRINNSWLGLEIPPVPTDLKKHSILTDGELAWLDAHPEITLATDEGWLPYVIVEKDGGISGVEADLVERINDLTGANIRLELGEWSDNGGEGEETEN